MKKLILILLAAIAFSCGDGRDRDNRASESAPETEDNYSDDALESDTTDMRMDTTSSPGIDRGVESDTASTDVNNNNP